MTDQESTLIIQEIINKAQEGRALTFRPILYWNEFTYYYRLIISTKLVIKTLKQAADNLFKEYCKDIIAGTSDFTKLLAYEQLLDIVAFYNKDLDTVQLMVNDYRDYLFSSFGSFINAVTGGRRND